SYFFFSSRRRHTRFSRDWSSDVCSSDLLASRFAHEKPPQPPLGGQAALFGQRRRSSGRFGSGSCQAQSTSIDLIRPQSTSIDLRSEERRVGKERRARQVPA